jgi:hypothetical protein
MFFPTSFFNASPTRRSIPLSIRMNRKETEDYLNCFRAILPANTGDLLWLIDRFLAETYPNGGELDLAAGLEVGMSVYYAITAFCSKEKYKNRPYYRSMLRSLVADALLPACSVLREPCEKEMESGTFEVGSEICTGC